MENFIQLIQTIGFPIVVALFFMLKVDKVLIKLSESMEKQATIIENMQTMLERLIPSLNLKV